MNKLYIWQYWEDIHNKSRPKYVDLIYEQNLNQILKINQIYLGKFHLEFIKLNPNSYQLRELFKIDAFKKLKAQQRSDIIRLYLLNKEGGFWLDSDILIYNPRLFGELIFKIYLSANFFCPIKYTGIPCNWFIFSKKEGFNIKLLFNKSLKSLLENNTEKDYTFFGSKLILSLKNKFRGAYFIKDFPFLQRIPWRFNKIFFFYNVFFLKSLIFPFRYTPIINLSASSLDHKKLDKAILRLFDQKFNNNYFSETIIESIFKINYQYKNKNI